MNAKYQWPFIFQDPLLESTKSIRIHSLLAVLLGMTVFVVRLATNGNPSRQFIHRSEVSQTRQVVHYPWHKDNRAKQI
jgi:hypothetical protein